MTTLWAIVAAAWFLIGIDVFLDQHYIDAGHVRVGCLSWFVVAHRVATITSWPPNANGLKAMQDINHVAVAIIAFSGAAGGALFLWALVTGRLIKPSKMNEGGDG